jgi:hypothetical protein
MEEISDFGFQIGREPGLKSGVVLEIVLPATEA